MPFFEGLVVVVVGVVLVLSVLVPLGVAYLYGVYVGRKAGVALGRAQSDAEWANMVENGAIGGV